MANEDKDVIRHEDTTAALPSTSRNGQVTFETDSNRRLYHATLDGTANHWTPDEKMTADISAYTNGGVPSLSNVKDALDYVITNLPNGDLLLTGSISFPNTKICYEPGGSGTPALPAGWTMDNMHVVSAKVFIIGGGSGFIAPFCIINSGATTFLQGAMEITSDTGGKFLNLNLRGDAVSLAGVSSFSGYSYAVIVRKL
jgi:hypothetical protein